MNAAAVSRRIAWIVFAGGLGGGLAFPILPALGLQLGIPAVMVGVILSANRISRLFFDSSAGRIVDRLGGRLVLSGALFVETVGVLGYSAALNFGNAMWWLLAGRVIFGAGSAFLLVGAQAVVLSLSERGDRGRRTSSVRIAMGAALPAGLVLGGVLADRFSDDAAFLSGAGVTFAGAVLAAVLIPSTPVVSTSGPSASGRRRGEASEPPREGRVTAVMASPGLPLLAAAWGFNFLIFLTLQGALLATLVVLVQQRDLHLFGMQAQGTSGLVMGLLMICSSLMAFAIGRRLDKVELRSIFLVPALAGTAGGFAVLAFAHTLWLLLPGAALVGLSYNGVTLPMMALLGDVTDRQHGRAVGIYQVFGDVGGAIGPIGGMVLAPTIGLMPLYLILAVLTALAIPAALWLRGRERDLQTGRAEASRST